MFRMPRFGVRICKGLYHPRELRCCSGEHAFAFDLPDWQAHRWELRSMQHVVIFSGIIPKDTLLEYPLFLPFTT